MKNSSIDRRLAQRTRESGILRGIFVHRLGEQSRDEQAAATFWHANGIEAEALETGLGRHHVRPDLRLSRNGVPWAYCEVKTLWHHRWTVEIRHKDRPAELRSGLTEKSAAERLSGDLSTALRVLQQENAEHALLNIVLLINHDPELSPATAARLLTPPDLPAPRNLRERREARATKEMRAFRNVIDLCFWAESKGEGQFALEGYFLTNPELQTRILPIADQVCARRISLEPAA